VEDTGRSGKEGKRGRGEEGKRGRGEEALAEWSEFLKESEERDLRTTTLGQRLASEILCD